MTLGRPAGSRQGRRGSSRQAKQECSKPGRLGGSRQARLESWMLGKLGSSRQGKPGGLSQELKKHQLERLKWESRMEWRWETLGCSKPGRRGSSMPGRQEHWSSSGEERLTLGRPGSSKLGRLGGLSLEWKKRRLGHLESSTLGRPGSSKLGRLGGSNLGSKKRQLERSRWESPRTE